MPMKLRQVILCANCGWFVRRFDFQDAWTNAENEWNGFLGRWRRAIHAGIDIKVSKTWRQKLMSKSSGQCQLDLFAVCGTSCRDFHSFFVPANFGSRLVEEFLGIIPRSESFQFKCYMWISNNAVFLGKEMSWAKPIFARARSPLPAVGRPLMSLARRSRSRLLIYKDRPSYSEDFLWFRFPDFGCDATRCDPHIAPFQLPRRGHGYTHTAHTARQ